MSVHVTGPQLVALLVVAWPSVEKSPVSESDAPMVIGVLELGLELALELVLVLVLVLLLNCCCCMPPERPPTALLSPRAKARLGSQGR